MATNDPRFLSPMGSRLAELGLDVKDVNVGRYVQIDLSTPRPEPEEFAEFGEFDTFTVLNPHDVPHGVWVYFNNKRPESRLPLHYVSRLETIADRFYLQHNEGWDGVTLHIILGGDLRALSVEPSNKGVVNVGGVVDISDRENRKLGNVSVIGGATETTLGRVRALLETLGGTVATESTLNAVKNLLDTLAGVDFAKEATLAGVAKESTLDSVKTLLETLAGVDFAKETTLAGVAKESTLHSVKILLETLNAVDFAKETTLAGVAKESTLDSVKTVLETLVGINFAMEETLNLIRESLVDIKTELQTQTTLLQQIVDNTTGAE